MVDAPASLSLARQGAAAAGSAAVLAALWLGRHNIVRSYWDAWIFWVPFTLLLATVGVLCWWFALQGHRAASRRGMAASWWGGTLVGGVALLAGFVGPLIATPAATLGPLLGILLTGPLGFVVGALGGVVVHNLRASG
jgi:hypothetical protein